MPMKLALLIFAIPLFLMAQITPPPSSGSGLSACAATPPTTSAANTACIGSNSNIYTCGPTACTSRGQFVVNPGSGTFTALSGDATSTATGGATSVVKVNGGSISATGAPQKSNASHQLVDSVAADIYGLWSGTKDSSHFLAGDGTMQSAALDTRTVTITDLAPVVGDSGMILALNPATAIHLTRAYCAIQGSTNVVLNLDVRAEGSIGTDSGHHLLGSDLTAATSGANTQTFANGNGQCGGTTSCAIAAHTPVVMTFTSVSGTPTALNCSVDYTVN